MNKTPAESMWLSLGGPVTKCVSIEIALRGYSSEFPKAKGSICKSLAFVGTAGSNTLDIKI